MSKTNENVHSQIRAFLQMFVLSVCGTSPYSPAYKRVQNFVTLWGNIFACFGQITLKLGQFPIFNTRSF